MKKVHYLIAGISLIIVSVIAFYNSTNNRSIASHDTVYANLKEFYHDSKKPTKEELEGLWIERCFSELTPNNARKGSVSIRIESKDTHRNASSDTSNDLGPLFPSTASEPLGEAGYRVFYVSIGEKELLPAYSSWEYRTRYPSILSNSKYKKGYLNTVHINFRIYHKDERSYLIMKYGSRKYNIKKTKERTDISYVVRTTRRSSTTHYYKIEDHNPEEEYLQMCYLERK